MKKIAIIYPSNPNELQKRALEILSSTILDYTKEYPICLPENHETDTSAFRLIYIGTRASNRYIGTDTEPLCVSEEYRITVRNDTVTIEVYDIMVTRESLSISCIMCRRTVNLVPSLKETSIDM